MTAKEPYKISLLDLISFIEGNGVKIKCVYSANTKIPFSYRTGKYSFIEKGGTKWMMVRCDYIMLEIDE